MVGGKVKGGGRSGGLERDVGAWCGRAGGMMKYREGRGEKSVAGGKRGGKRGRRGEEKRCRYEGRTRGWREGTWSKCGYRSGKPDTSKGRTM